MLNCGAIGNDKINNQLNGYLLEAIFNNYDNVIEFNTKAEAEQYVKDKKYTLVDKLD